MPMFRVHYTARHNAGSFTPDDKQESVDVKAISPHAAKLLARELIGERGWTYYTIRKVKALP